MREKRLIREYNQMKQQIEEIKVFGVKDIMYYRELEIEMINRGLLSSS